MEFFKRILSLILLFSTLTLTAQEGIWKSYLSPQQINDLVDTGSELYIATDNGLVIVDKNTLAIRNLNTENSNLPNNHIQAITKSPTGTFWIGTYDVVLARFDGETFTDFTTPEGVDFNEDETWLYDLEIDANNNFWIGSSVGLFFRENQEWNLFDSSTIGDFIDNVWDIEINEEGTVYAASIFMYQYKDGVWSNMTDTTNLFAYEGAELFLSQSGELYFTGHQHQIGVFDGSGWEIYSTNDANDFDGNFQGSQILYFTEDINGNVYFNSNDRGVYKLNNNTWSQQDDPQVEAFSNKTSFFYIDNQNTQWLNHRISLSKNHNGSIDQMIISSHPIERNYINKIRKDDNGTLYFVNGDHSIATLDINGNWATVDLPDTFETWEYLRDILVISPQEIWLTTNQGFYIFDGTEWTFTFAGTADDIVKDSENNIYIGTANNGFYKIENGLVSNFNTTNSPLQSSVIFGMGVDAMDNFWVSTGNGYVHKISNEVWTTYHKNDHPVLESIYGAFHFDIYGNVWVPGWGEGAVVFDGNEWKNFGPTNSPIPHTHVYSITSDAEGKMYFAHGAGISTLQDNTWEEFSVDDLPMYNFYMPTIALGNDGVLWWGGQQAGLFAFNPEGTTSIGFPTAESNFKAYPNPAHDFMVLDYTIEEPARLQLNIYNHLGQRVLNKPLGTKSSGQYQEIINLAHFPKGIYTIQLDINGNYSTHKMIIQ